MSFLIDLSIIGGGLTGTAMLWQCIGQARMAAERYSGLPARIRIRVFERQDRFGPGFPHHIENVLPCHITNMCASDMGIFCGRPRGLPVVDGQKPDLFDQSLQLVWTVFEATGKFSGCL